MGIVENVQAQLKSLENGDIDSEENYNTIELLFQNLKPENSDFDEDFLKRFILCAVRDSKSCPTAFEAILSVLKHFRNKNIKTMMEEIKASYKALQECQSNSSFYIQLVKLCEPSALYELVNLDGFQLLSKYYQYIMEGRHIENKVFMMSTLRKILKSNDIKPEEITDLLNKIMQSLLERTITLIVSKERVLQEESIVLCQTMMPYMRETDYQQNVFWRKLKVNFRVSYQSVIMEHLKESLPSWKYIWVICVQLLTPELEKYSHLMNLFLVCIESAVKSTDIIKIEAAFECWKVMITCYANSPSGISTTKVINLICALFRGSTKQVPIVNKKFFVWIHFLQYLQKPILEQNYEIVFKSFILFCFGTCSSKIPSVTSYPCCKNYPELKNHVVAVFMKMMGHTCPDSKCFVVKDDNNGLPNKFITPKIFQMCSSILVYAVGECIFLIKNMAPSENTQEVLDKSLVINCLWTSLLNHACDINDEDTRTLVSLEIMSMLKSLIAAAKDDPKRSTSLTVYIIQPMIEKFVTSELPSLSQTTYPNIVSYLLEPEIFDLIHNTDHKSNFIKVMKTTLTSGFHNFKNSSELMKTVNDKILNNYPTSASASFLKIWNHWCTLLAMELEKFNLDNDIIYPEMSEAIYSTLEFLSGFKTHDNKNEKLSLSSKTFKCWQRLFSVFNRLYIVLSDPTQLLTVTKTLTSKILESECTNYEWTVKMLEYMVQELTEEHIDKSEVFAVEIARNILAISSILISKLKDYDLMMKVIESICSLFVKYKLSVNVDFLDYYYGLLVSVLQKLNADEHLKYEIELVNHLTKIGNYIIKNVRCVEDSVIADNKVNLQNMIELCTDKINESKTREKLRNIKLDTGSKSKNNSEVKKTPKQTALSLAKSSPKSRKKLDDDFVVIPVSPIIKPKFTEAQKEKMKERRANSLALCELSESHHTEDQHQKKDLMELAVPLINENSTAACDAMLERKDRRVSHETLNKMSPALPIVQMTFSEIAELKKNIVEKQKQNSSKQETDFTNLKKIIAADTSFTKETEMTEDFSTCFANVEKLSISVDSLALDGSSILDESLPKENDSRQSNQKRGRKRKSKDVSFEDDGVLDAMPIAKRIRLKGTKLNFEDENMIVDEKLSDSEANIKNNKNSPDLPIKKTSAKHNEKTSPKSESGANSVSKISEKPSDNIKSRKLSSDSFGSMKNFVKEIEKSDRANKIINMCEKPREKTKSHKSAVKSRSSPDSVSKKGEKFESSGRTTKIIKMCEIPIEKSSKNSESSKKVVKDVQKLEIVKNNDENGEKDSAVNENTSDSGEPSVKVVEKSPETEELAAELTQSSEVVMSDSTNEQVTEDVNTVKKPVEEKLAEPIKEHPIDKSDDDLEDNTKTVKPNDELPETSETVEKKKSLKTNEKSSDLSDSADETSNLTKILKLNDEANVLSKSSKSTKINKEKKKERELKKICIDMVSSMTIQVNEDTPRTTRSRRSVYDEKEERELKKICSDMVPSMTIQVNEDTPRTTRSRRSVYDEKEAKTSKTKNKNELNIEITKIIKNSKSDVPNSHKVHRRKSVIEKKVSPDAEDAREDSKVVEDTSKVSEEKENLVSHTVDEQTNKKEENAKTEKSKIVEKVTEESEPEAEPEAEPVVEPVEPSEPPLVEEESEIVTENEESSKENKEHDAVVEKVVEKIIEETVVPDPKTVLEESKDVTAEPTVTAANIPSQFVKLIQERIFNESLTEGNVSKEIVEGQCFEDDSPKVDEMENVGNEEIVISEVLTQPDNLTQQMEVDIEDIPSSNETILLASPEVLNDEDKHTEFLNNTIDISPIKVDNENEKTADGNALMDGNISPIEKKSKSNVKNGSHIGKKGKPMGRAAQILAYLSENPDVLPIRLENSDSTNGCSTPTRSPPENAKPSPFQSPSSILKRSRKDDASVEEDSLQKRKRVSFNDPLEHTKYIENRRAAHINQRLFNNDSPKRKFLCMKTKFVLNFGDHHMKTIDTSKTSEQMTAMTEHDDMDEDDTASMQDDFSNAFQHLPPDDVELQPIYPSLQDCMDPIGNIIRDISDPSDFSSLFCRNIITIGDIARLSIEHVNSLPILSPKTDVVISALKAYEATTKAGTSASGDGAPGKQLPVSTNNENEKTQMTLEDEASVSKGKSLLNEFTKFFEECSDNVRDEILTNADKNKLFTMLFESNGETSKDVISRVLKDKKCLYIALSLLGESFNLNS